MQNPSDLSAYEKYKTFLAAKIAAILIKYEALI
jgi:hypothetical protein